MHRQCEEGQKNAVISAWECGQLLNEQKERLEHGEWLPWVMLNCEFDKSQATRYMQLASNYAHAHNLEAFSSIRSALRLIAKEAKKNKPPAPPVEQIFSWEKDERIIAMESGLTAIREVIPVLKSATVDVGYATYRLKMLRKSLIKRLEEIGDVGEP